MKLGIPGLLNPLVELRAVTRNMFLVVQLTRREIESQFRGTILGWLWLFARPLLLLSVYTFVFGVIWRRDAAGEPLGSFAVQLFCGLCLFNFFSQSVVKACNSVVSKSSFVRQMVFPLEILPWVQLWAALIMALPWFLLLFTGIFLVYGHFHAVALLFPLWLIPLFLLAAGFSWFVASLGVYVRDLRQLLPVLMQVLFFLSPVFWHFSFLTGRKAELIPYLRLNPLANIIEESRKLLIYGEMTDFRRWAISMAVGLLVFHLGFLWFQKTRKGFADVL